MPRVTRRVSASLRAFLPNKKIEIDPECLNWNIIEKRYIMKKKHNSLKEILINFDSSSVKKIRRKLKEEYKDTWETFSEEEKNKKTYDMLTSLEKG